MIVETHIFISQILYKHLKKNKNFKLNMLAFMYGNIKPDFNYGDIKCPHSIDESIVSLNKYSRRIIEENLSSMEFSISLGVICHFICDYFCLYHGKDYGKKNIFQHILYEIFLHFKFLLLIMGNKIRVENKCIYSEDIIKNLLEIQNKYQSEDNSLTKDITYAISAAVLVSESIMSASEAYSYEKDKNSKIYELLEVNGGSL